MKLTPRLFCAGAILATLRVAHAVYAADDREFRGHTPRVTAPLSDELMRGDGLEWILSLQAWRDFHSLPPRRAPRPPKCTLPQAEAQQDRQDTAAAIRKIAEQEEKALLESRQRRAAVLDAAHRHFNNFDKILAWPPQSFWDKIGGPAIKSVGRAGPKMTTEEAAVLDTLKSSRVDLRFDAALFPTILGDLIAASSVYFVIDAGAWRDLESAEISLQASGVTVHDALQLIMLQASAEGEVVWEITGNIVRFIKTS